jgi:alanine racemase
MKSPTRNCHIEIDTAALQHNLQRIRQFAPDARVMPVVKANAYGHGMAEVVRACDQADAFAVAMLPEAVRLRELGCDKDIIVFHGFASVDDLVLAARLRLQPTVHSLQQLAVLDAYAGEAVTVWLKVNTGMHRLGIDMADVAACYAHLQASANVTQVHVMSHFANADDPLNDINNKQIENILKVKNDLQIAPGSQFSIANSAATVAFPGSHLDWVRPGIMLYGAAPLLARSAAELELQAVMTFGSKLLAVRQCRSGDAIGYGSSWQCPQDMPVGIVAAGYADGYPRHAPAGTPVMVNGQLTQIIGRVSMDSLYVDCRNISAQAGDAVEFWGKHVAVDDVAHSAGTIAYELLCQAGNALDQTG